jgi:folate-binding protein YgfZ
MGDDALLAAMRGRNAACAELHGTETAAHFGDAAAEYRALREHAGLVDLPWVGRLHVTGGDRVTFLQGMLSNDVAKLAVGAGCPALLLTEQGKAVADMLVLAAEESTELVGVATSLAAAQTALERFIVADDVEIGVASATERTFALLGPDAAGVLQRLGTATTPAATCGHVRTDVGGARVELVRVATPGAGGFLCRVPTQVAEWWERCASVGGAVPVGYEAAEVLRIESGLPWHGRDVTTDTLALEAPYDAAISFRKGCYLGQEVMERVTARGHVNRKLVGVEIAGDVVPTAGTRLFADGKDVGWLTSAAWSWRGARVIGLAYVRREHLAPGSTLVAGDDASTPVTVGALPF